MDEATASVDPKTDNLLQQIIREDFANRTVLTIAHRILTIIDYDLVMVLDKGRLVELDSPANLLRKNPVEDDSYFAKMVLDTGAEQSKLLRNAAFHAEKRRTEKRERLRSKMHHVLHQI